MEKILNRSDPEDPQIGLTPRTPGPRGPPVGKPCKDGADFSTRNILDLHLTWSWDSFNLPSLSVAYYSVGHCEIDLIDSHNSGCVLQALRYFVLGE